MALARFAALAAVVCLPFAAHAQTIVRSLGASDDRYMPSLAGSATGWKASIPPLVESGPVVSPGGGYCFAGDHPTTLADSDTSEPQSWHEGKAPHKHSYAPLDLRLFTFDGKCYQFTGDPTDFGVYGGLFAFHGMHPVAEEKGGGWCYQDRDHSHNYRMRSPYMQRIAEKYYWGGGFDAQFRVYYPYYVHFFRDLYPLYYAEGQYIRSRATAPSIKQVPLPDEMVTWGPAPAPQANVQAAAPVQAPAGPAPNAIPSSMAAETTVIYATPPVVAPGYGYYGYQQYGAPLGGYGHHHQHGHGHGQGWNAPPAAPPPAAPPQPPPTLRPVRESSRGAIRPIIRQ